MGGWQDDRWYCRRCDSLFSLHEKCLCGEHSNPESTVREFETGATRDTDEGKLDFEGFLSPLVLERFAEYMHLHRKQSDGELRDSDNWQRGIPKQEYMKSLHRHFMDVWKLHRGYDAREDIETAICGCIFNLQGYLHTLLAEREKK